MYCSIVLLYYYAHFQFIEYDLNEKSLQFSTNVTPAGNQRRLAISNILLDPHDDNKYLLQNDTNMLVMEKRTVSDFNLLVLLLLTEFL